MTQSIVLPRRLDVLKLLATPPAEPDFVLPGLPVGAVGSVVAPGGTGKTMLLLQLAMELALGRPRIARALGTVSATPSQVVLVAAEEGVDEIHRRLHHIAAHCIVPPPDGGPLPPDDPQRLQLQHNLHLYPLAGAARLLLDGEANDSLPLLRQAAQGARLVVLDPLRQFHGGDENDSAVMTHVVQQCQAIAVRERCAVLVVHHTNKQAAATGQGDKAEASRGSGALTDAVRWQLNLSTLDAALARSFGIPADLIRQHIRMDLAKANYIGPGQPAVLRRQAGGVLALCASPTAKAVT